MHSPSSNLLYRSLGALAMLAVAGAAFSQGTLTLQEALRLARERNGIVQAAFIDVRAAGSRVTQALSDFYPTVTPSFRYNSDRRELSGSDFVQNEGGQSQISASWRILDSGEREYSLLSARRSREATQQDAIQTLRNTLFAVHEQYFNTIRAQELLRVAEAQVQRTQTVLEQTITKEEVGAGPAKDILQARADALNAKVEEITARNRTVTAEATLKATIGWEASEELPALEVSTDPEPAGSLPPLEQIVERGLSMRADLVARRRRIEAQRFVVRRNERQAGVSFGLDLNFDQQLTPDSLENRTLSFLVSYPLFDGGRAREVARESRLNLQASEIELVQAEREARADIESAYVEFQQNTERLKAAQLALEAARENYKAASESFQLGAQGTNVVTVAIAQVSLVTAESNYIEATYDYYTSDVRLRLVTGQPVPGER